VPAALRCTHPPFSPPRRVEAVNISPFLSNLPRGKGTRCFSTPDASGSTSQAAAIQEALEAGARTLLVDEDTTATNFMIRDARMLVGGGCGWGAGREGGQGGGGVEGYREQRKGGEGGVGRGRKGREGGQGVGCRGGRQLRRRPCSRLMLRGQRSIGHARPLMNGDPWVVALHAAQVPSPQPHPTQPPPGLCQELVSGAREPITPFLSRLPALAARGLSCILVIGGSGQYFDVAGAQRCQSHSPACLFGRRFQESPAWRCRVPAACCATLPPSCCDSLPRSPV
jgi:hypothetical protein